MIRYQITDGSAALDEESWFSRLRADVDFIQVREPALSTRELARVVLRVKGVGPKVLVNDRTDVAIACGAAGVHLRSNSLSQLFLRRIVPSGFLIGVSCHDAEDVTSAEGADYALLAPVFPPLSKAGTRTLLGLDMLRQITRHARLPVIALGGITPLNAPRCIEAGASGVAGITLFR